MFIFNRKKKPNHPVAFIEDYEDPTLNEIPAPRPNLGALMIIVFTCGAISLVAAGGVGFALANRPEKPQPIVENVTEEMLIDPTATLLNLTEEIIVTDEPTVDYVPAVRAETATPTTVPTNTVEPIIVEPAVKPTSTQSVRSNAPDRAQYTLYNIPTATLDQPAQQPTSATNQQPAAAPPAYNPPASDPVQPPPVNNPTAAPTLDTNAVVFEPPPRTDNRQQLDTTIIDVIVVTPKPITGTAVCVERDPITGLEKPCDGFSQPENTYVSN